MTPATPTSAARRTAVRRPCVNGSVRDRVLTRHQSQGPNRRRPLTPGRTPDTRGQP
jgi:hypothetical protein